MHLELELKEIKAAKAKKAKEAAAAAKQNEKLQAQQKAESKIFEPAFFAILLRLSDCRPSRYRKIKIGETGP